MQIENKYIDQNSPTFIIAELSGNHNKSLDRAMAIVKAASDAGADAVKLQTYTADSMTLDSDKDIFHTDPNSLWAGMNLYSLYKKASTPYEWHRVIRDYANELGLIFFSSPFDIEAVDFLADMNVPCYKIASFEINDIRLIKHTASKQKPMIISTGTATIEDIHEAINACKSVGNNNIILLKCTSAYPTPIEEVNLAMIPDMAKMFNTIIGLSDHTIGDTVSLAGVAMGAKVIEKHLTLTSDDITVDSKFSMTKDTFKVMVDKIRLIEKALGKVNYELTPKQKKVLLDRRSLFTSHQIKKGEKFTDENIKSVRPAHGLNTKYYDDIIGKEATKDIEFATPLTWDMIKK